MKARTEEVWRHIFESTDLDEALQTDGFFQISSQELREFSGPLGGPDARNLVKFDHSDQLPTPLKKRRLSVLPVARGKFIVGPLKTYMPTAEEDFRGIPLRRMSLDGNLETLSSGGVSSESSALMVAKASGMIDDFLGEACQHTGFGKTSPSEPFSFLVDRVGFGSLSVDAATSTAMEIDGIYESKSWIAPIEAKNRLHRDFHIRQIYYPVRAMVSTHRKTIRSVLLTHHDGIYQFREVLFTDFNNLSSFEVRRVGQYTIGETSNTRSDLAALASRSKPDLSPRRVSFPQADKFEKVLFVVEKLLEAPLCRDEIADLFGYAPRQGDYYANAAVYIGLAKKSDGRFHASPQASKIFSLNGALRFKQLAEVLLEVPSILRGVQFWFAKSALPKTPDMVAIMKLEGESVSLNPTTEERRARTAIDWVDWLVSNFD